jgi:hypothetical protein
MDFITGFPNIVRQHDYIMVVLGKLTKATHFVPIKSTHKTVDIAKVFMRENFRYAWATQCNCI